ncbi:MAG: cyclase family protein [Lachnospiraceae bacterium]|nr:cyclase family protein [Lachnospiraceae bacterium]
MKVLDLTHCIDETTMPYPGDEAAKLIPVSTIEKDGFRETFIEIYSHTGTHMDSPAHMLNESVYLDDMPADNFCGSAYVLDCTFIEHGGEISLSMLKEIKGLSEIDFLILSTGWEKHWGCAEYFLGFPVLSLDATNYLMTLKLKGIGMDTMSIDKMENDDFTNHIKVFENNKIIIENLCNLSGIRGKTVWFAALPMKFKYSEGAPVRAVAME